MMDDTLVEEKKRQAIDRIINAIQGILDQSEKLKRQIREREEALKREKEGRK